MWHVRLRFCQQYWASAVLAAHSGILNARPEGLRRTLQLTAGGINFVAVPVLVKLRTHRIPAQAIIVWATTLLN
jgi:hypothetical protein